MKKSAAIASMLFMALGAFGCSQDKEQKSQVNYTPATAPTTMMQVDQMQEAAKMAPKDAQAWINLGNAFMDAQRFGEAVDAYQKALALDPKNVNVIVDMGTCYRGTGKFDKAVEQYRRAIKIDPNFPNAHRNLGVVLSYDLHDTVQGVKAFKKYLELSPTGPDADAIRQSVQEMSSAKPAGK